MGEAVNKWHCGDCYKDATTLDNGRRSLLVCSRSDLPVVDADPESPESLQHLCYYLGRPRDRGYTPPVGIPEDPENPLWKHPLEDPWDGCPGGDQVSPLVTELLDRYYRRSDHQGNRVSNPLLDRCEDELVIRALMEFEAEEDACSASRLKEEMDEVKRKADRSGS